MDREADSPLDGAGPPIGPASNDWPRARVLLGDGQNPRNKCRRGKVADEVARAEAVARAEGRDCGFVSILGIELDRAYRVAGHILGNTADAEDATQEALERAWASWHTLRTPEAAQGWFWRILVNGCRSRMRRQRSRPVRDLDQATDLRTSDPFRASLARDAVGRAMRVLNDDQRVTVALRYWGELTVPEIADRMRVPEGTVKSRLHSALAALRRELERNEEARS
jgi:RNA polymerase sigma factor (sigma-70 family)